MEDISRRAIFTGVCAVALAGATNFPAAAASSVTKLKNGKLSVRVAQIPELAEVGGTVSIGLLKGKPVGISRTAANSYRAFSLLCPHQGIPVKKQGPGWVCPAHLSEFEPDGDLLLGPASTGLPKISAKLSKGVLTVG